MEGFKDMKLTEAEKQRLERIITEASSKPPKRIYSDDALWMADTIIRLLAELEKMK